MLLRTERLLLRHFQASDAPSLSAYRSDPDVARHQSWPAPYPLDAAVAFIASMPAAAGEGWFQYAVCLPSGELVGDVGVNRSDRQAEIGFTLASAFQGRGYAAEAVGRMVTELLVTEGLHRVHASVDARNVRSARLLERLGFRREGHLVQASWWKGEWTDDLLYAVLAAEWSGSGTT